MVGRWTFLLRVPWRRNLRAISWCYFFLDKDDRHVCFKKKLSHLWGKRGGHEMFFCRCLFVVFVAAIFFGLKKLMLQKLNLHKKSPPPRHEEVSCKKGKTEACTKTIPTSTEKCCDCVFVCSCFLYSFMHLDAECIWRMWNLMNYNSCFYVAPCVKTRGLEIDIFTNCQLLFVFFWFIQWVCIF